MDSGPKSIVKEQSFPFADWLRTARETAKLSQEELAERSGLSPNTIGALERGEHRRPYPATIRALVRALGLGEDEQAALSAAVPRRARSSESDLSQLRQLPTLGVPLIGRER